MSDIPLESLVAGRIWKIEKHPGDPVAAGEAILLIESMKMEIPLEAPCAGTVARLDVAEGDVVNEGQVLAMLRTG